MLGSATPSLQVATIGGWGDTAGGYTETNMYPDWTGDEAGRLFKLKNNTSGTGTVPYGQVVPTISDGEYAASTWDQWKDNVQIRFWEDGETPSTGTGWGSLNYWSTNTTSNILLSNLNNDGAGRNFRYQVRMLSEADPDLAGGDTMTFKINFVGMTP
ncbi:MAG: hypothetical protein Q8P72_00465 [Candidatus Roizmanbacteria bacterium]|nr:hypothetical protein [Candidatus Roizmanbacteria bacterium]